MGNAESGIGFSEDFIGQVNAMAAAISEEGSIPITSLKPLVEVLKIIGQSVRNVEETCSRLEHQMHALREQQLVTDKRVALQGLSLQEAFKAGLLQEPAPHDDAASNTEEPARHRKEIKSQEQKEKTCEVAGAEAGAKVEEEKAEEKEAQNKKSKKKRRRGRVQTTSDAATEPETNNSSKTEDTNENDLEELEKLFTPKSVAGQSLFDAAGAGRISELRALLDAGLDPNMSTLGGTALHRAASAGHLPCVSLLLKRGAHPNVQEVLGRSPLHLASLHGRIDCMNELIKHGASLTSREGSGQVPLHYAAIGGFEKAVKEILKRGAEVDVGDSFGQTPLSLAVAYDKPDSTQALLEAGARRTDNEGRSLVSSALSNKVKQLFRTFK